MSSGRELWNRCDVCGQFIALHWFDCGEATRDLVTPDSDYSKETWETLCPTHNERQVIDSGKEEKGG